VTISRPGCARTILVGKRFWSCRKKCRKCCSR